MDNSIGLKELQIVSGALRKGDEEFWFYFYFLKDFFGWGEDGVIPFLLKGAFLGGLRNGNFFGGWGLSQGVVSWMAWKREVWLFFKVGRLGFLFFFFFFFFLFWFFREFFLWWCEMGGWRQGVGFFFSPFFFP